MIPSFEVPPQYFYALAAGLPTTVTPEVRYRLATLSDEKTILDVLRKAIEDATIVEDAAVTVEMAARRLRALGSVQGITPVGASGVGLALTQGYAAYETTPPDTDPTDDIAPFWNGVIANAPQAAAHLEFVLAAIFQLADPRPLIAAAATMPAPFPALTSVQNLDADPWAGNPPELEQGDWLALFTAHPEVLPPIIGGTGSLEEQVGRFVARLRAYFEVTSTAGGPHHEGPLAPATFALPAFDPIRTFVDAYRALPGHASWGWGDGLDATDRDAAVASVPMDDKGRAWLAQAVAAVEAVFDLTSGLGVTPELQFSLAEALYARGFTTVEQVRRLTRQEFADVLIGSPAHAFASDIWTFAEGTGTPEEGPGTFHPVNPGDLTDCRPPCELSATGDLAYLRALLDIPVGGGRLEDGVQGRRGPLGDLAATSANATVPVPVIDLVNECLEAVAETGVPAGVVHDTDPDVGGAIDAETWLRAVPEYSSPATPVSAPGAYAALATDFSAPQLPYSQPLDLNRRHLEALGIDRYTAMRGFRRDISEFVRDREAEPADFPRHVRRYPVRLPLALEYLCISTVEYDAIYTGPVNEPFVVQLYGYPPETEDWSRDVRQLSVLLSRLGLDYCDLYELSNSGLVPMHVRSVGSVEDAADLPECEPCCLADYVVFFDEQDATIAFGRLAILVRLWRTLRCQPGGGYSFADLADVADVLGMFSGNGVDPDFIPQLAALGMLRWDLGFAALPIGDLLDLWRNPAAPLDAEDVETFIDRTAAAAQARHDCRRRGPDFEKLLATNLDVLSELGGFDPLDAAATWRARPSHTLRFVEELTKIYASTFGIGELLFACTAQPHLAGDDPSVVAPADEAELDPLQDPDDDQQHSLWQLRGRLLQVEPDPDGYTWTRIREVLGSQLGWTPAAGTDPLHDLGAHLFPDVLERAGEPVAAAERRYAVGLPGSPASMWNTPDSPFRYASGPDQLTLAVPFDDDAVLTKLSRIRPLQAAEQEAVRSLYHLPLVELAAFGYLFDDLDEARARLHAEADQDARWAWFRARFALFHARCAVIVEHLAEHVLSTADPDAREVSLDPTPTRAEAIAVAWRLLPVLLADENAADSLPWTRDDGHRPDVRWDPTPVGGAFAAITGLAGTGLLAEYRTLDDDTVIWRAIQPTTDLIRPSTNAWNAPAPTLIPALSADLPDAQQRYARSRNGILISARDAEVLGGVEGYRVTWSGALLVERAGAYDFWGGEPDAQPGRHAGEGRHWRVLLRRGQKSWVLLAHNWQEDQDCFETAGLRLRRGTYDVEIELIRDRPGDDELDDQRPLRTGLRIEYRGPDTDGERTVIPTERLYLVAKRDRLSTGTNDSVVNGVVFELLSDTYVSSLRDARRTYQRAFKAVLVAQRFGLSAELFADYAQSELGYLLDHRDEMAGLAFYDAAGWQPHRVDFDPNLLPLFDSYHPPAPAEDDRVAPSTVRRAALFDLWERLFDHTWLRAAAGTAPEKPVWLLYDEAAENQPDNPAQLLRHLGVDLSDAELVLNYDPGYAVTASDLTDERWATRAWHADRIVREMVAVFAFEDIRDARPDLWAADDPGAPGEGNENLAAVVRSGFVGSAPRRFVDLQHLDDCLRVHARDALVAYLCRMDRVALPWPGAGFATAAADLSALLLMDVESGPEPVATRVSNAVAAINTLVSRARLGLEPPWRPDSNFLCEWDTRYADCAAWAAWRRRELYPEDRIAEVSRDRDRASEAFRFLEDELRRATLTVPIPGGLEYWDAEGLPTHPGLVLLQQREASRLRRLSPVREGLDVLGTPDAGAERSWLAPEPAFVVRDPQDGGNDGHDNEDGNGDGGGINAPAAPVPPVVRAAAGQVPGTATGVSPLWIEAAVRLGARFLRVAAAGPPAASQPFAPRPDVGDVTCESGDLAAYVGEYYFWLVDTRWYDDIEQVADWPGWHEEDLAAPMLVWTPDPMVHLMWSRLHDGELEQPRRSVEGLRIGEGVDVTDVDLVLVGRSGDSVLLCVTGGAADPGAVPPPDPGFRYDLVPDQAYPIPEFVPPLPADENGGDDQDDEEEPPELPAYPFFVYSDPGAPLFPLDPFSEAVTVAEALRTRCSYEAALRWYGVSFDSVTSDNRWCRPRDRVDDVAVPARRPARGRRTRARAEMEHPALATGRRSLCCTGVEVGELTAQRRHVTISSIETLLAWGDGERMCGTAAGDARARLLYAAAERLLGPAPVTVHEPGGGDPQVRVRDYVAAAAELNPRLVVLWEEVAERQELLRRDPGHPDGCCCGGCDADCCGTSPYRFGVVHARAAQLAAQAASFGGQFQAALERGDGEHLATVRARQEHQVAGLARTVRQEQWRDADWQVQALQITKQIAEANYSYYDLLITNGLGAGELDYQELTTSSTASTTAATIQEAIGTVLGVIPDVFVGTTAFTHLPIGTKLAEVFQGVARIQQQVSAVLSGNAGLRSTQGGWDRRLAEWQHQRAIFLLEIQAAERQILAAERRRAAALRELNTAQRQVENTAELLDLQRDKTTSSAHFLWLQKETAALYRQLYDLALRAATQAERAFNAERGFTQRRFLPDTPWEDAHKGLLAGERLALSLHTMDQAFSTENEREFELTKHVSLRKFFPAAFLSLKVTGTCVLELPEWLFDLDYPGHYLRRIKSVSLSLPCVVTPYAGVHCRLTLLSSTTRVNTLLLGPQGGCCADGGDCCAEGGCCTGCGTGCPADCSSCGKACDQDCGCTPGYALQPCDPRAVRVLAARNAIATSTGINDSGLFELNFRDERYLPFELAGAVSRWRIEMPPENNDFDLDSLSDVIMHVNYTARDGGPLLRAAATGEARRQLPDAGTRLIDVRREMPQEWARFVEQEGSRRLELRLSRDCFAYAYGDRSAVVKRLEVFVEAAGAQPSAHREVEFQIERWSDRWGSDVDLTFTMVCGAPWCGFFQGAVDVEVGPVRSGEPRLLGVFDFEEPVSDVERVFLVVHYDLERSDGRGH
ncbi:insecticidal toxin complex protein [Pseudonocardia sp. RS11V-5]|uniref:Tc toxin subunit A-related protein n=1 Tax=Pseudonocardia terrae TaxID=2905831 RepID=UPI001E2D11D3|nr:neuraminidase-like domain-containing protein [Pseudonocardia terrae]MCE3552396.1 insecticidal toxin complex protein [Pseudonocardia terrae]